MNKLKEAFNQLPEVQRIKELEHILDSSETLKKLISDLKIKQKQMVHAKEFQQLKQYQVYQQEYEALYNVILDFPFVEEYLELLERVNELLSLVTNIIENEINKKIN